jgi:voltage-gated potassium channel
VGFLSARKLAIPTRLLFFWSVPIVLIGVGTVGYRLTEGWPWFDAFYVAVVTLTSIGYGDKHAFTMPGRVLTLSLALVGISALAVAATELLGTIITGELPNFLRTWRMGKRIDALEGHVIVCGYGHVGRHVCADLVGCGVPVVVVDRQEAPLVEAGESGAHPLQGDATVEATLQRAGIDRARALIAVAGTDADAIVITMTARLLCPLLPIVARAEDDATVPKLLRVGATRTASPHAIAGGLMAQAVLRPAVAEADLQMEEQLVPAGSPLDGKTVGSSGLRARRGRILVAIKRPDGQLAFNPEDDVPVAAGDTLITLGSRQPSGGAHAPAVLT